MKKRSASTKSKEGEKTAKTPAAASKSKSPSAKGIKQPAVKKPTAKSKSPVKKQETKAPTKKVEVKASGKSASKSQTRNTSKEPALEAPKRSSSQSKKPTISRIKSKEPVIDVQVPFTPLQIVQKEEIIEQVQQVVKVEQKQEHASNSMFDFDSLVASRLGFEQPHVSTHKQVKAKQEVVQKAQQINTPKQAQNSLQQTVQNSQKPKFRPAGSNINQQEREQGDFMVSIDDLNKSSSGKAAPSNRSQTPVDESANIEQIVNQWNAFGSQPDSHKKEQARPHAPIQPTLVIGGRPNLVAQDSGYTESKSGDQVADQRHRRKKIVMNDADFTQSNGYMPNKLPFKQKRDENEALLVKQKSSHSELNPESDDENEAMELKKMLLNEHTGTAAVQHTEPFLIQLPGTLPIAEVKPHQTNALQAILEKITTNDIQAGSIGKLRFMKSGKVVLRLQIPGNDNYVDLEVNKGIEATFYQELVSIDKNTAQAHFLAQIQKKLVATPDLDSLFD